MLSSAVWLTDLFNSFWTTFKGQGNKGSRRALDIQTIHVIITKLLVVLVFSWNFFDKKNIEFLETFPFKARF